MDIGEKIKRMRIEKQLTQEELANRCELSKGFISQLENNLTSPSIATLIDILEILGTNLREFFNEIDDERICFTKDDMFETEDEDLKYTLKWLVPNSQKNEMEPIILNLEPKGKSKVYDPNEGEILLDNINIKDLTEEELRKNISIIRQEPFVFNRTIKENFELIDKNITLNKIRESTKMAYLDDYINTLPKKYDTVLNEEGMNISKGQKQLLTIARAMLLDSKMLILDEATSNVDTRTEVKIQEAMKNLMKDKTCFVIAHRLSTIRNADLILVVKDGEIIEQGNHNELMKANGFYAALYYSQFD